MKKIIEVKNLIKNYGSHQAVKKISFDVYEGEFFAFLGENGAGKSTTINILCGVLAKTGGEILIDSLNIDKHANKVKELIGIVFQSSVLDNELTVKENLQTRGAYYNLKGQALNTRITELTNMLNLSDILNQKYGTLSGGQRRRVDIARALIHTPKILFLDEPTTGLDPQTRQLVWKIINDLRISNNLTIFLTTHYMEETLHANNVVILDKGIIVAEDSPINLKTKYAKDVLKWYTDESNELSEELNKLNYSFKYDTDAYIIYVKNSLDATKLILNYQDKMTSYEVIRGDMDDVFLNVTGKILGD